MFLGRDDRMEDPNEIILFDNKDLIDNFLIKKKMKILIFYTKKEKN